MSAWAKLLAASSLAVGNAWALISSPRTGGGGTSIVDSIALAVAPQPTMAIDDTPMVVLFDTPAISMSVSDQITLEVQP